MDSNITAALHELSQVMGILEFDPTSLTPEEWGVIKTIASRLERFNKLLAAALLQCENAGG